MKTEQTAALPQVEEQVSWNQEASHHRRNCDGKLLGALFLSNALRQDVAAAAAAAAAATKKKSCQFVSGYYLDMDLLTTYIKQRCVLLTCDDNSEFVRGMDFFFPPTNEEGINTTITSLLPIHCAALAGEAKLVEIYLSFLVVRSILTIKNQTKRKWILSKTRATKRRIFPEWLQHVQYTDIRYKDWANASLNDTTRKMFVETRYCLYDLLSIVTDPEATAFPKCGGTHQKSLSRASNAPMIVPQSDSRLENSVVSVMDGDDDDTVIYHLIQHGDQEECSVASLCDEWTEEEGSILAIDAISFTRNNAEADDDGWDVLPRPSEDAINEDYIHVFDCSY